MQGCAKLIVLRLIISKSDYLLGKDLVYGRINEPKERS